MRRHGEHRELLGWLRPEAIAPLVRDDALAVIRFEPVSRAGQATIAVDLIFGGGDEHAVVPLVLVDPAALLRRTAPPLIWPVALGSLDDAVLDPIERRVVALLEAATLAAALREERIVVLDEAARRRFDAARADGALGAAPLATACAAAAPYVRVLRFARERHVAIRAADGAHGAAVVRAATPSIALDHGALRDPQTVAWYGLDVEPFHAERAYEVAVVAGERSADAAIRLHLDAAHGMPIAVAPPLGPAGSDDPDDGPAVRRIAVVAAREPAQRSPIAPRTAAGGSAGRVLLLVRPDAHLAPDADLDEATALARELAREGLEVRISADPAAVDVFAPDLLHVIGVERPAVALDAVQRAARRGLPSIVSPLWDAPDDEGRWGSLAGSTAVAAALDEAGSDRATTLLAARRVSADGTIAGAPFALPWATEGDLRTLCGAAGAVLAQSATEAARLHARFGIRAEVVGCVALPGAQPASIGALVGDDAFVLARAPIRPEANLLPVVIGAARLGYPLVVAGPVVDRSYAARLRALGGPTFMLLPEPDAGEDAALYTAARVVVDVAWIGRGDHRVALARAAGAEVVVADRRAGGAPGMRAVDRADGAAIASRIGDAWFAVGAAPAAEVDGAAAFQAIVKSYAATTGPVAAR